MSGSRTQRRSSNRIGFRNSTAETECWRRKYIEDYIVSSSSVRARLLHLVRGSNIVGFSNSESVFLNDHFSAMLLRGLYRNSPTSKGFCLCSLFGLPCICESRIQRRGVHSCLRKFQIVRCQTGPTRSSGPVSSYALSWQWMSSTSSFSPVLLSCGDSFTSHIKLDRLCETDTG